MRDLKIVFMGTPEFAVSTLDKIVQTGFNVAAVITAPDRPAGRGRKISESAVKKYAMAHEIPVMQPTRLKDPVFISELKALDANLFVVVAFRMLPRDVWEIPEYGTFNLHASLLPQYRGAAPINWAIINGETETGVTTFFINQNIDTGEIIEQLSTAIGKNDTAGDLHDRLMETGAQLVVKTIESIASGKVMSVAQKDSDELKPAPKIHKDTCRINWKESAGTIYNHIRGLSPYPGAWTILKNGEQETEIKIFSADIEKVDHNFQNGAIISTKKELKVAVRDGFLILLEIQLSGKRKMSVEEVLNGLKIQNEALMS